ncbi:MAG TPA: dTDP-glucose 4,6-dehydratase [Methanolinea sp.]|jgi:dTDP-glucose 4,6-dehydratase|nr:MAG: dTDP-glucose 4,6 dehydratase [Methanoregulaceae archaeon PtaU1.Bin066]HII75524.1 dTDP-glucose 4,6-dehydratase [Methanolinea sp.]HNQ28895.1 dTDP-glucose 4,6-dehydratase [Methanolinea sp.]
MTHILVTGVAGFIGSNFVYHVLGTHPEISIVGLDSLTYAGNLENIAALGRKERERFTFVRGDIGDRPLADSLISEHAIDAVVNFAAESHVDRSIEDPQLFLRTNILGTCTLLDAARAAWQRNGRMTPGCRFLQVSTDEVYGSLGPEGYFTEETPLDPHSPYSASKAAADMIAKAYHDTFGMPVLITRCSNNYGPYQFPEKLIPLIIRNALQHRPLPVYGDGKNVRDWLYVEDHCRAIDVVLRSGQPGEVYNIGGNNEWENIAIVRLLLSILQEETGDPGINESLIQFVKDRPGHDQRYAINSTKISRELGWEPATPFPDGIKKTVRWYLDHQDWMERVISGEYQSFYERNYEHR